MLEWTEAGNRWGKFSACAAISFPFENPRVLKQQGITGIGIEERNDLSFLNGGVMVFLIIKPTALD